MRMEPEKLLTGEELCEAMNWSEEKLERLLSERVDDFPYLVFKDKGQMFRLSEVLRKFKPNVKKPPKAKPEPEVAPPDPFEEKAEEAVTPVFDDTPKPKPAGKKLTDKKSK